MDCTWKDARGLYLEGCQCIVPTSEVLVGCTGEDASGLFLGGCHRIVPGRMVVDCTWEDAS